MIVKIVCNGEDSFSSLYSHQEDEYIIGVDGGCKTLINNHVKIDLAVGDFDSSSLDEVKKYTSNIVTLNRDKDYSDLDVAMEKVEELKDVGKVIIYNATGKRLDHYHGNINVICRDYKYSVEMMDKNNLIFCLNGEQEFKKDDYKYLSIFALTDNTLITISGFKYCLKSHMLSRFDNLCLSNELDYKGIIRTNKKVIIYKTKE